MYYKLIDTDLRGAYTVHGPGYELTEDNHAEHAYPVDGWHWFATIDDAMRQMRGDHVAVTQRQARLALAQSSLLEAVEAFVAAGSDAIKIEWQYATEIRRDWPPVNEFAAAKGISDEALDDLFALAATL